MVFVSKFIRNCSQKARLYNQDNNTRNAIKLCNNVHKTMTMVHVRLTKVRLLDALVRRILPVSQTHQTQTHRTHITHSQNLLSTVQH